MTERVRINDVGPRDGLQNMKVQVAPADRAALARGLVAAGVPAVEVGSFVSPKAVPAMEGAAEVLAGLDAGSAEFSVLVPNERGFDDALAAGARSIAVVLSATDTMNRRNINMDLDTTIAVCARVLGRACEAGVGARAYVAVAVECPFEGLVAPERVRSLTSTLFDAGADEVIVADTIGAACPAQVRATMAPLLTRWGNERLSLHLHDTRAMALANAWQALECGVRRFDSSIGGLGGCPFAPGAAGNLATEDLVLMLHQCGYDTGIEMPALLECVALAQRLTGQAVGGRASAWLEQGASDSG
jgi:hydroxymethylglutaryl-CoA lyase